MVNRRCWLNSVLLHCAGHHAWKESQTRERRRRSPVARRRRLCFRGPVAGRVRRGRAQRRDAPRGARQQRIMNIRSFIQAMIHPRHVKKNPRIMNGNNNPRLCPHASDLIDSIKMFHYYLRSLLFTNFGFMSLTKGL